MPATEVLLLTNRDSDNLGDQIIEASDISLLKAAAENLGLDASTVKIRSRAASLISRKYMSTRDESLLEPARRAISRADVIVFGGAPLFNYKYQLFYLRTIRTLELADEYGVPVIFSSIGVEPHSEEDSRSIALQRALELPVVRQVTTRDDLDSTQKYMSRTDVPTALVSDPAVFADTIFEGFVPEKRDAGTARRRVIGLVVTRTGIFPDNGINFSPQDQVDFWKEIIEKLEERGDDYRMFTTGHFDDEIFLDSLVRHHGIPAKKTAITLNSPEELIHELTGCDGVIAYRLHASITSFAFGIPSVGLSWNFKVPDFYRSMDYPDRAIASDDWNAGHVVSILDRAMAEGVEKDEEILMSVYRTLFEGLRGIVAPEASNEPFTQTELHSRLPRYRGTSQKQYQEKMRRKLRRSYGFYQDKVGMGSAETTGGPLNSPRPKSVSSRVLSKMKRMLRS